MRLSTVLTGVLALVLLLPAADASQAATFSGVGDLPGGSAFSWAEGLSADGTTVVGSSTSASGTEAFRRRQGGEIEGLGDLPGGAFVSVAEAASADGSVIVGWSVDDASHTGAIGAFRWTEALGMQTVADFWPSSPFHHDAQAVSADGTIVGGWNYIEFLGTTGFGAWMIQGNTLLWQLEALDITPHGQVFSPEVTAMSADGSVWAGRVIRDFSTDAVIWTEGGTVFTFVASGTDAYLYGLSPDASTAVGALDGQAYVWTATGGLVMLGDLPGGTFSSTALDVSADGRIVVGAGTTDAGSEPFVWDADNGMRNLAEVLECRGAHVAGWELIGAVAISDDAFTIAGNGRNPNGDLEAWTATAPSIGALCPPTAVPALRPLGALVLIVMLAGLERRATRLKISLFWRGLRAALAARRSAPEVGETRSPPD